MTPDRFIAAAFTQLAYEGTNWNLYVTAEFIHRVEQRASELARESVGDGEIPPKRLPDDGNGDEDAYNAGFNACRELWITAWNTRAREVDASPSAGGDVERDAARYRWLRQYNVDSYLANGKLETLDAQIDAVLAGVSEGKEG